MSRNLIIAANWKLNKGPADAAAFLDAFCAVSKDFKGTADIVLAPTALTIPSVVAKLDGCDRIAVAAQNVSEQESGAFTGEISLDVLCEDGGDRWEDAGLDPMMDKLISMVRDRFQDE